MSIQTQRLTSGHFNQQDLLAIISLQQEALRFYASCVNKSPEGRSINLNHILALDRGTRARQVLELSNDYLASCGVEEQHLIKLPYAPYFDEIDQEIVKNYRGGDNAEYFYIMNAGGHSLVGTMLRPEVNGAMKITDCTYEEIEKKLEGKHIVFHVSRHLDVVNYLTEDIAFIMKNFKPKGLSIHIDSLGLF